MFDSKAIIKALEDIRRPLQDLAAHFLNPVRVFDSRTGETWKLGSLDEDPEPGRRHPDDKLVMESHPEGWTLYIYRSTMLSTTSVPRFYYHGVCRRLPNLVEVGCPGVTFSSWEFAEAEGRIHAQRNSAWPARSKSEPGIDLRPGWCITVDDNGYLITVTRDCACKDRYVWSATAKDDGATIAIIEGGDTYGSVSLAMAAAKEEISEILAARKEVAEPRHPGTFRYRGFGIKLVEQAERGNYITYVHKKDGSLWFRSAPESTRAEAYERAFAAIDIRRKDEPKKEAEPVEPWHLDLEHTQLLSRLISDPMSRLISDPNTVWVTHSGLLGQRLALGLPWFVEATGWVVRISGIDVAARVRDLTLVK